jgi:hypothetical protein
MFHPLPHRVLSWCVWPRIVPENRYSVLFGYESACFIAQSRGNECSFPTVYSTCPERLIVSCCYLLSACTNIFHRLRTRLNVPYRGTSCTQLHCSCGHRRVLVSVVNFPPLRYVYVYLNFYCEIFTDTANVHCKNFSFIDRNTCRLI